MPAITNDWAEYLKPEYSKEYYRDLFNFVGQAYATQTVYPPADDIFNAFHNTPLSKVKCVIIGQDPYHEPGQAHGLSFSVKPGVAIPPSLVNIYQELHDPFRIRQVADTRSSTMTSAVKYPTTDILRNGQIKESSCSMPC